MKTELLFQENTYLYAMIVNIINIGFDDYGYYFITDKTIYYPQGGGQPNDNGHIEKDGNTITIVKAKYNELGQVKHYTDFEAPKSLLNKDVAMHVNQNSRKLNSAYHTAGHWLSQIVNENLELPLFPSKGHHFAGEAYVEFDGNIKEFCEDIIDNIKLAIRIDLQTQPTINSQIVASNSALLEDALLPINFKPLTNRPLRLVTISGYKSVPCGGTHLKSLRELRTVTPKKIYKKGKRIRLTYECSIWNEVSC
jgi:alanyl-tRNA synthetase